MITHIKTPLWRSSVWHWVAF